MCRHRSPRTVIRVTDITWSATDARPQTVQHLLSVPVNCAGAVPISTVTVPVYPDIPVICLGSNQTGRPGPLGTVRPGVGCWRDDE